VRIRARLGMSVDGFVATPDGWPALVADPAFVPGESHGMPEFLEGCEAALMGHTTFMPGLASDRWPWPNLDVFVLASERPEGTPEDVVTDSHPERLLEKIRERNQGGAVHLVGGPRTIETYRALGALDELYLVVLPLVLGDGLRLTPGLSTDARLRFRSQRELPGGSVEIVCAFEG
jgi:dihydrofolate reductase